MERPPLIILTRRHPFHNHGGDVRRICQYIKALGPHFSIHLIYYQNPTTKNLIRGLGGLFFLKKPLIQNTPEARFYGLPFSLDCALYGLLCHVFQKKSLQTALFNQRHFTRCIDDLVHSHGFKAGICHLVRLAPTALKFPQFPWVLEMTDAISLNLSRDGKRGFSPMDCIRRYEAKYLATEEKFFISHFRKTILVSPVDRDFLLTKEMVGPGNTPLVIANAMETPSSLLHPPSDPPGHPPWILGFVGKLSYYNNQRALEFITEEIFPLLLSKNLPVRLRVVGSSPSARLLKSLKNMDFVDLVLSPDSTVKEMAQCHLALCPIHVGAGIQNKVLDALAAHVPVVISPQAAMPFQIYQKEAFKKVMFLPQETTALAYAKVIEDFIGGILMVNKEGFAEFSEIFSDHNIRKQIYNVFTAL